MREKDLKSIKIISLEINRIKETLNDLGNTGNSKIIEEYKNLLHDKENNLLKKKIELETFINSIDDAEIRLILTLKFIDLKSWNYISRKMHYDRSTVYKKFKSFIQSNSK